MQFAGHHLWWLTSWMLIVRPFTIRRLFGEPVCRTIGIDLLQQLGEKDVPAAMKIINKVLM